jgi:hypothetical protein
VCCKFFALLITRILLPASRGGIAALGRFFIAKYPALRAGLLRIGDLTVWFSKWDEKRLPDRQFDLRPMEKGIKIAWQFYTEVARKKMNRHYAGANPETNCQQP